MSIAAELIQAFPDDISTVKVTKSDMHGEDSTEVVVGLMNGKKVTGNFAKHPKSSFGGVQFSGPKDVVALMTKKITSVLEDTYERSI